MESKMECDVSYYDFLNLIHVIGINNKSIQKQNVILTIENYDIKRVKYNLEKEIEKIDKALQN
ncbi:MAG: hypothetical protein P8Y23_04690 [Candidatus Lokiarchaeota archaeon]|jgi:hypothetical protein